jgi:glycosyltransferase involved in cell wall biosynthesis
LSARKRSSLGDRDGDAMTQPPDHRFEAERLMVIVPDRLSDLIKKGEFASRYYNPGELFKEVHLVATNDDRPDLGALQRTVGGAKLVFHNLPTGLRHTVQTLGWQRPLIEPLLKRSLALAAAIKPQLIRTHNNFLEGEIGARIQKALGIPLVVSLHGVWDVDDLETVYARIRSRFRAKLERSSLASADAVIAIYAPIQRYARLFGARRVELIYNIVAGENIARKLSYELSKPPRLITINRQVPQKNPSNIIRAIAEIDCHYTIVGDGVLHERLRSLAADLGCSARIEFIKAAPNAELCARLRDFDIMVSHCDYWGTSKTIIEAGLAGLPIVINRHPAIKIDEYSGGWLIECENTAAGYKAAILDLLGNTAHREQLGGLAWKTASARFDPAQMERQTVALYRELLARPRQSAAE